MPFSNFADIKEQVSLAPYSTYKIGGPADYFINLKDISVLPSLLTTAQQHNIPVKVIGGGTNILFADAGYRGLIIRLTNNKMEFDNHNQVTVGAGTRWPLLIMQTNKHGFNCLDRFRGLPGTIGGAVYGNAGACGLEMKAVVNDVAVFDQQTHLIKKLNNEEIGFGYRTTNFKQSKFADYIITQVSLKLFNEDEVALQRELENDRRSIQPQALSCGCFFINPLPHSAGKLIDEAGLKGFKIGGISVSTEHANFLVNNGSGTAAEAMQVAEHVKKVVYEKHQVKLTEEVQMIGFEQSV